MSRLLFLQELFQVSVEKIILFRCMFHDDKMDISAYILKNLLELHVPERKIYDNITFFSVY